MRQRLAATAGACSLGLIILAAGPVVSSARDPSAELALCDRLAAEPADPDKPANVPGVAEIAPADVGLAIKYCKIAAAASRRALYQLGRAYAANQQMPEAVGAYRKAADKGSSAATVELGLLYANGSELPKDEAQARTLFERAAAAGNPRGGTNLAALSQGAAGSSDPAAARALLARAADANSAEAQFQLGLMMANGFGGPKDEAGARALFEKAAAQGHAGALDWAGSFAEFGRGGPEDRNAAKAYYEKAAALGNEDAKAALERMKCPLVLRDKRGEVWTHLCF